MKKPCKHRPKRFKPAKGKALHRTYAQAVMEANYFHQMGMRALIEGNPMSDYKYIVVFWWGSRLGQ